MTGRGIRAADGGVAARRGPGFLPIDALRKGPSARAEVLASGLQLEGDSLKRPPTGYAADHPYIEDLKRKDFYAMTTLSEAEVCAGDFVDRYLQVCRSAAPLVRFITVALDLRF